MDKIIKTIKQITELDYRLMEKAQGRLDSLTKPKGSLGRLEDLAKLIVGITKKINPTFKDRVIFTLASDHGVSEERISAFPKEVTAQMVYNFLNGNAAINVLARHAGARVIVVDMGVAHKFKSQKPKAKNFKDKKINFGTKNMTKGPAMTRKEAEQSIAAGLEIFEEEFKKGIDIMGTGDMGIGNTTASSAIASVFTRASVDSVAGRGTGVDEQTLKNKIEVIRQAIGVNAPNPNDPIDVLSKVGGFEIGGLAGIIISAAAHKIPVVIDGFISGASALIAYHLEPKTKGYMIASHCSAEKGHRVILQHLGLNPLLDLNLRLGEGTGAALGIIIAEAAVKILTQMATFESANVSKGNK